jgi:hypothetical protein
VAVVADVREALERAEGDRSSDLVQAFIRGVTTTLGMIEREVTTPDTAVQP